LVLFKSAQAAGTFDDGLAVALHPGLVAYTPAVMTEGVTAALVCVASAVAYVVATSSRGRTLELASALGIALGTHLVLVLLMVIRRVFALTENRLLEVRTGAAQAATLSRRPKQVRERQVG
jgi:hypothetical protein